MSKAKPTLKQIATVQSTLEEYLRSECHKARAEKQRGAATYAYGRYRELCAAFFVCRTTLDTPRLTVAQAHLIYSQETGDTRSAKQWSHAQTAINWIEQNGGGGALKNPARARMFMAKLHGHTSRANQADGKATKPQSLETAVDILGANLAGRIYKAKQTAKTRLAIIDKLVVRLREKTEDCLTDKEWLAKAAKRNGNQKVLKPNNLPNTPAAKLAEPALNPPAIDYPELETCDF